MAAIHWDLGVQAPTLHQTKRSTRAHATDILQSSAPILALHRPLLPRMEPNTPLHAQNTRLPHLPMEVKFNLLLTHMNTGAMRHQIMAAPQ